MTEFELAENIRDGTIPSPVEFSNMWLVNLRITGTGLAYRTSIHENVWRNPDLYLNDEFLKRCNGLPVIKNHPEGAKLTEEDFKKRVVGCVMLPYIKGDEVWAVVRIYIRDVVDEILKGKVSTSPSVVFDDKSGNVVIEDGDTTLLIEGKPFLLDHIALVTEDSGTLGVWDKNKIPEGIDISNTGDLNMNEEELKRFLAEAMSGLSTTINTRFDAIGARMDSLESSTAARLEAEAKERAKAEKARADAAAEDEAKRADAEEEEAKQKEAEEKAKADAAAEEEAKAAEEKAKADSEAAEEESRKDEASLTTAQVMADSAYAACGKKAPSPFAGENSMAYRKRILTGLQKLSATHKDLDIRAIADSAVLAMVEKEIFADAKSSTEKEIANTPGHLVQFIRNDEAGRPIKEFKGDMDTWLNAVKFPAQKLVEFNTRGGNH